MIVIVVMITMIMPVIVVMIMVVSDFAGNRFAGDCEHDFAMKLFDVVNGLGNDVGGCDES